MVVIEVKRVYGEQTISEGTRVLVDRLWPRGISKERAALDLWLKEIAPSNELRKSFHGGEINWDVFRSRYEAEVAANEEPFQKLLSIVKFGSVVLLYGSHDVEYNHALILKDLLEKELGAM